MRAQTYTVAEKLTADVLNNVVKIRYPEAYEAIVYRISKFHQIAPPTAKKPVVEKEELLPTLLTDSVENKSIYSMGGDNRVQSQPLASHDMQR